MGGEEELRGLEKGLSALMEKREELDAEVNCWVEERERCNDAVRTLRARALGFREKRDAANLRVRELRSEALKLRNGMSERREELQRVIQRLAELKQSLSGDRRRLEGRLRELDWEVMTTPTREMLEREDQITKEIKGLKIQLEAHEEVDDLEDRRLELRTQIMSDQIRVKGLREEIGRLSSESQTNHEKMIEVFKKIDQAKQKADEAHRKALEARESLRKVGEEALNLRRRLQSLRGELAKEKMDRLRGEAVQRIREKMRKGEKLTFEEFKLLSEVEKKEE